MRAPALLPCSRRPGSVPTKPPPWRTTGLCVEALDGSRAQVHGGHDLLGFGARWVVLSPWTADDGRRMLIGVARLYDEGFDPSEVALLEAVTESVGHALERAWFAAERTQYAARQTALVRAAKASERVASPRRRPPKPLQGDLRRAAS